MVRQTLEIKNRLGLHARAAAKLVHTAGAYRASVLLEKSGDRVDAKSILGLLQLGAAQGTEVTIECSGEDEAEALAAVVDLIDGRFGEDG